MQRLDAHLGQGRLRPWGEFFDTQRFKVPSTADVLLERTSTNLQYYAVNYALLSLAFLTCLVYADPRCVTHTHTRTHTRERERARELTEVHTCAAC